jgi:tetrahydromethanopterin S-methyltransferase subunit F
VYLSITDNNRIKEHRVEYGNSVNIDGHRRAVLDIAYRSKL